VTTVDARGLVCPLPLAMAKREMSTLTPGAALVVLATDPEAPIDLAAWADDEGHGFVALERAGWHEFVVTKRPAL
jgi:tRNA 2-thiouridine synthesizing protein A